jgi:hypothetical protein
MDAWQWILLGAAAFVAVVSLVRLMQARRDELIADMRQQMEAEQQRREVEERRAKRKARRENAA